MKRPNWIRALAARPASPTISGMMGAAAALPVLVAMSFVVLLPAIVCMSPRAPLSDAATLCGPGVGPLQQFRDDLEEAREEVVYIHESVHAEQCRTLGATRYIRRYSFRKHCYT